MNEEILISYCGIKIPLRRMNEFIMSPIKISGLIASLKRLQVRLEDSQRLAAVQREEIRVLSQGVCRE